MGYLIDGNNLIGHIDPSRLHDTQIRKDLLEALSIFKRVQRTTVSIVFDGPPDSDLQSYSPQRSIPVYYPPPDSNADRIIKNRLEDTGDRRHLVVVSSDGDLLSFVRSRGARYITSPEFLKRLRSALKRFERRMELTKPLDQPSRLEVEQWLNIFGKR